MQSGVGSDVIYRCGAQQADACSVPLRCVLLRCAVLCGDASYVCVVRLVCSAPLW